MDDLDAAVGATPQRAAPTRAQVVLWGFWDWGSSAYNTVVLTFVFPVYLTGAVGDGSPQASEWLGYALGAAGFLVAVLAPVLAQRADAAGRRKRSTGVWTAATVAAMLVMFLVADDYAYLWLGLALVGVTSVLFEFASVSYNAMLTQVSTDQTVGRVSGFGWAMGYLGGIVLLLLVYVGFIAGEGGAFGVPTEAGLDIRIVVVVAAIWFVVFALPMFRFVPEIPRGLHPTRGTGIVAAYRTLFTDLRALYRSAPHTVYFLLASALFRDGLNGVFAFGAVLAVAVYGIAADDVLIFAVAANVVAAAGALAGGRLEDVIGPKRVIIGALVGLLVAGGTLIFVSGPAMFWVFGLALCMFVGPAQASSRSYLAQLAPVGQEGQLFGLYATTGRAASFLAPTLFGVFIAIFDAQRAGIGGILTVLALGLVALLPVRPPARREASATAG